MSYYKSTGYGRGRPRKDEERPLSPNALAQARWRKKKLEIDPEYKLVLAERQRKWRSEHKAQSNKISREYQRRKKTNDIQA